MKKVININFQGRVIPIEESAYDLLKQYIDSLRIHFANEQGGDEIINDIEGRVAELFDEVLKKGATCITDEHVAHIIASIGRPEDFETEDSFGGGQQTGNDDHQQHFSQEGTTAKRLYRDENNKVLGGVCAGIANYTGVDSIVIRIIAVLTMGVSLLPYIILWAVIPGTSQVIIGSQRKRLFRDPEHKILGGVCGGLSQYFGVSIWLPRLLFILPFLKFAMRFSSHLGFGDDLFDLTFSPGAAFLYIILWIILPEAKTTSERLEMKGEKIDINSIKDTIQNDMVGFSERAQKFGKEVSDRAGEIGKNFGREAGYAARKSGRGLGDVVAILFKFFAYFIIGVVLLALTLALFSGAVGATSVAPLASFVLVEGVQTSLLWIGIILLIWVPAIGLVAAILRRLMGRPRNKVLRYTFWSLWLIGIVCLISLVGMVKDNFRTLSDLDEVSLKMADSNLSSMEVYLDRLPGTDITFRKHSGGLEYLLGRGELYLQNTSIDLMPSADSHYHVVYLKSAYAMTLDKANQLAEANHVSVHQQDSALHIKSYVTITRKDKFRNQQNDIVIEVPIGKRVKLIPYNYRGMDKLVNIYARRWAVSINDDAFFDYSYNKEYIMTTDGAKRYKPTTINNIEEEEDEDDLENETEDRLRRKIERLQQRLEEESKKLDKKDA